MGLVLVMLAIVSGLCTFAILTGLTPITPTPQVVITLLSINGAIVAAMALMIGWQVLYLLKARRHGVPGASLHTRIVASLSLFAAVPAVIVALFAAVTLDRGLDTWFSERTQSIVDSAITVAESYLSEQGDIARNDIEAIANGIAQQKSVFENDRNLFLRRLATISALRSLTAAYLINQSNKRIEASVTANRRVTFESPSDEMFRRAAKGELVVEGPINRNLIRAIVKLKNFDNHFLYVYRSVNPEVIQQLAKARAEKAEYDKLLGQRTGLQLTFALMYSGVMFVFLLAAIWLGMWFADRLVEPIVNLVGAARRVSTGQLDVKVDVRKGAGDLANLGSTFNRMTEQLQTQRDELVATNHQLDERRRFSEAVLSGVSAGVIGLDPHGVITLTNRSALRLLSIDRATLTGKTLPSALPQMEPLYRKACDSPSGNAQGQLDIRVGSQERNFVVRVTTERSNEDEHGYVVTFDDITELVSAQRNSAWADIARRIAHEIKNPLTPIQLSAERLRRKYSKEIKSDPKVFDQCTETIIRQVGDIGRMVDEFSSFARMPSAVLETNNLATVVREAMILQKASLPEVEFTSEFPEGRIEADFDRRLITQAVINLVKNALEAIEARQEAGDDNGAHIKVAVSHHDDKVQIDIADNGIGLPKENRGRLVEPYMTTREKGTGLGLAIVKRIMEEHDGRLELHDAPAEFEGGKGAMVRLLFPRKAKTNLADVSAAEEKPKVKA
ncbi:MAG: PAS domain-containing sensor histidine kinase, partial [Rhizobiales bacterium]|nr:PAS domain-containing sensor histidine kinase [Hyphomicrobiales bacterium]